MGFGIYQWSSDRRDTIRIERNRRAALYVNPFLDVCEDLQSRLYNLLQGNGLSVLRARYPNRDFAEETLHMIARYFAWERIVFRYGPYTRDPEVIRLTEAVRDSFASSQLTVGPFCFFRGEQQTFADLMIVRREESSGVEFDTLPLSSFRELVSHPPLEDLEAVTQSLESLKSATSRSELGGADRLVTVHHNLVDLLTYLESREGISLFQGERKLALK